MAILIHNVNLICFNDVCPNTDVLVDQGKIIRIASDDRIDADHVEKEFYCEGKYLAPGFIDLHFHGSDRFLIDKGVEDLKMLCSLLPKYGVTGFLPTLTPRPKGLDDRYLYALASTKTEGAERLGFFLEGPFLALPGAIPPDTLEKADADRIHALKEAGAPFPVIFAASPDLDGVLDLLPLMAANETPVFTTHTRATVEEARNGIRAGIRHATHFYDVFPCLPESDPGVRPAGIVEVVLSDPSVSVDFVLDGEHVDPVVVKMALACKGPDMVCLATDANLGAGLPPGIYKGIGNSKISFAYEGAPARIVDNGALNGCLAGSGLTMDQAVRNAVDFLDLELPHAVRLASYNPAKVLGLHERKGIVKEGYDADLVLLDEDLRVVKTWVGGRISYNSGDE